MLKQLLSRFKKPARAVMGLPAGLLMAVFYFVVMAPFGMLITLREDYMGARSAPRWRKRPATRDIPDSLKRQ